jgi:hypothetical protein
MFLLGLKLSMLKVGGQAKKMSLVFHGAFEHEAQELHERPSLKNYVHAPIFDAES